jgi:sodium transport system permease protein
MNGILAVLKKELLDGVRDRRALFSLVLFPLLGPVLVSVMLSQTVDRMSGSDGTQLPVVGRDNAPALVKFLEERGIEIEEPPADVLVAVRERDVDAVLVIPDDYGERFRDGRPATVQLVVDDSRTDASATVPRVHALLQAYSASVGTLRLLAHGTNPELMKAVDVQRVDLSTPKKRAAVFLNLIPMFVLIASFIGGMYVATDATAGERERGSLEPLLITPISRRALVMGKWLTTLLFSSANVVFTLAAALLSISQIPSEALGISLTLSPWAVLGVLVAVLPLSFFVASAQLMVASFARTFKEAQTYLSLMLFFPMIPGMMSTLSPIKTKLWMMAVPVLGQQQLLGDLIRGDQPPPLGYALAALASLVLGLVCVVATASLFERESIIYGR